MIFGGQNGQTGARAAKRGFRLFYRREFWIDVPEQVELMLSPTQGLIAHQPKTRFEREHRAAMLNPVAQPHVSIMAAHKKVEGLTLDPPFRANVGQASPTKRPLGFSLLESVHHQRVVR